jgi:hypothetical protein
MRICGASVGDKWNDGRSECHHSSRAIKESATKVRIGPVVIPDWVHIQSWQDQDGVQETGHNHSVANLRREMDHRTKTNRAEKRHAKTRRIVADRKGRSRRLRLMEERHGP